MVNIIKRKSMKNVELRVEDITAAYVLLGEAKYQKLSDEDKVKVWKISRKLFPVAEKLHFIRIRNMRASKSSGSFSLLLYRSHASIEFIQTCCLS